MSGVGRRPANIDYLDELARRAAARFVGANLVDDHLGRAGGLFELLDEYFGIDEMLFELDRTHLGRRDALNTHRLR